MPARPNLSTFVALIVLAATATAAPPAMRRWTDVTGKFSVEAELVESDDGRVVLKNASGATVTVPLARLSDADQAYLKALTKPNSPSADASAGPRLAFPDAVTEPPPWHDANTPFDLAAFLQAPPPEENAAPLYLEAFYEFAPTEMAILLSPAPPEEESTRLLSRSRELRTEKERLDVAWQADPQSVAAADMDLWLANYDVGFKKLAAAQQRPKCMFQPGRSCHSLLPHVQAAREIARVVVWRTRRDLARGDLERPCDDLEMMLRLSRDLQVTGAMVAQLVAIAMNEQCCQRASTILAAPGIDVGHCDRLLALLAEHEAQSVDAFVEGTRAEFIFARQTLHDLQHRTGTFDAEFMRKEFAIDGDVTSPLACIKVLADLGAPDSQQVVDRLQGRLLPGAWQGGKMLSDENYAQEVAALNRFFKTILSLAQQPDFGQTGAGEIEAAEALMNDTVLATLFIPAEGAFLHAIRRGEARLHGTQCLAALRRWQLEHAQPPPDLGTIVKTAGMQGVPMDPFSGQPMRVAFIDQKPVIYSFGPDGRDDQAKIEWTMGPQQPGDFIFRLESPSP